MTNAVSINIRGAQKDRSMNRRDQVFRQDRSLDILKFAESTKIMAITMEDRERTDGSAPEVMTYRSLEH